MISTVVSTLLLLSSNPTTVKAPIVAASMFKNNYAVTVREFAVPGPGEYQLDPMPRGSLGTLWFWTSGTAKISRINTLHKEDTSVESKSSIDGILSINVGKTVRLGIRDGDAVTGKEIEGKLIAYHGNMAILQTEKGQLVFPSSMISSAEAVGGTLDFTETTTTLKPVLQLAISQGKGTVHILALESGLTWSPSYAVDISDPKILKLTAKAEVINDLDDLNGVAAKFITGFPNIPYAGQQDPLTLVQSISAPVAQGRGGGGALVGGQGLVPSGVSFVSYDPVDSSFIMRGGEAAQPGEQLEDLFFYNQPNLTLTKNDVAYIVMFEMQAPYKHLYVWDQSDSTQNNVDYRPVPDGPGDVWHELTFENKSPQPFTMAVATTMKNGEIVGQDTLPYVSPGRDAELKITKALDIRAESVEDEVDRQRMALPRNQYSNGYDLVTLKGTMELTNSKKEDVAMRIRKDFTGEFVSADDSPVTTKVVRGLLQVNPTGRMTWNITLKPGEKRKISYTYKLYVRSA